MFRKNTAGQFLTLQLNKTADGTGLTGATVAIRRCIDGTFAAATGTVTEDTGVGSSAGFYKFAMSQADTNGNDIGYAFTASGAITVEKTIVTTAGDPTDSVRFGLTSLPNAAASAVGGLPVAVDTSGRVDVLKINGTSQTARDIGLSVLLAAAQKVDVDTIKTQAVTCAAGVTVLASVGTAATSTAQTGDNYARIGAPAGASVSADIAAAKVDTAAVKVKTDLLPSATAGAAGGVFIAGTNAATAITTGLTAHIIGTVDTVTTYTGNTPQTGDAYARLGAPAGASVSADVAATKALLPTALVGGKMDSHVNDIASGAITATSIAADAITDAKVASDVTIASVTGAVGSVTGLTASDVGAIKAKTDNLPASPADESLIIAATNSLASAIAALSIPSAATVAAAVRDVSNSSPAAGSLGEAVRGADAKAADLQINLGTPVVTVSADIAAAITSIIAGVLRTTMTEGYAAEGSAFTLEQGMFMLEAQLRSRMLVGDSPAVMTSHKLDGTTVAMTYSVDNSMDPTTQERAT